MYIFISIIDKRNAFGVRQMSLQASGQANEPVLIPRKYASPVVNEGYQQRAGTGMKSTGTR
ncbi:hypothetical protein KAM621c_28690 [Citrobacter braakii]|jgi:hypothetical protein|uniref:Uncharacterized protein n=1 Tax=Citrobacter braakii TaxID=57706 RepID=A0AAD1P2T0_CITBR|nr:hypothetical protein KAM621c_28690 [Citrobacter braakii]